jgi:hypothetical protein
LTRPRATSRRARPFSNCTVVEIATHPILRDVEVARNNPTHSPTTRVCVSCVTNHRIVKKHQSVLRIRRRRPIAQIVPGLARGQSRGNTALPRGQGERSIAFAFKEDSFRVKIDPQGKPAGLRSIPSMRDGADVALLIPGQDPMVTHLFPASGPGIEIPGLSISGQVFQGSP